jgi:beta-lactamase class A
MMRFSSVLSTVLCLLAALPLSGSVLAEREGIPDLREARDAGLQSGLEAVVAELGLAHEVQAGRLSLAVVDLTERDAPRLAMLNGDEMMYAASLPKIAILLGALAEVEAGRIQLDETRLRAMTGMIRYSSNEDATRVLKWVGEERLLEILQSPRYRFYDVRGAGGLWVGKSYGKEGAYRRDPIHNLSHGATAFQVARLYYLLANDALLTRRFNAMMKEMLSKPGIHHKFVKALEGIQGIRIFRKSGSWKDYHADSALVEYGAHRYVLVGLAEHPDGGEWLVRLGLPLHRLLVGASRTMLARH